MSFLSKLLKVFGNRSKVENVAKIAKIAKVGNTEPNCPYCDHVLEKMPGRKKKCPECSQFICVRTCPHELVKILIREDQIETIEENWAIVNGTHEQFLAEKQNKESIRSKLISQGNASPTELDVQWIQLESSLPVLASDFKWGVYRNARLGMGDILKKRGYISEALNTYLEVCFIDLNGPNNCGTKDPELLKMCPPFDPKSAFLAPGVLGYVYKLANKLELQSNDIESRFIERANNVGRDLGLPISPSEAWQKLSSEQF
ncbi:hypothetical protein [Shewanella frigidimarina]|uniref:hypothetical protein n=1 Tax=Shewanella frigidimarina TaxID=56812 RepID=UPI000F501017|nr:hypothetical protein [Shewanella frigidimarina]RPA35540.1 hypothetical protein EGC78_03990 [Shewanella frigidimarina]